MSRRFLSQTERSSKKSNSKRSLSQPLITEVLDELNTSNVEEQLNELVRYVVLRAGINPFLKRQDMLKAISCKNKGFDAVLTQATEILKTVYGLHLTSSAKGYFVKNNLPFIKDPQDQDNEELPEQKNKILLVLILTHIFMTTKPVLENSLLSFLESLNIKIEGKDAVFGDVRQYISQLCKSKYLELNEDVASKKNYFIWGERAEKEISKQQILQFACKIYKDKEPKQWKKQYEIALQQNSAQSETQEN